MFKVPVKPNHSVLSSTSLSIISGILLFPARSCACFCRLWELKDLHVRQELTEFAKQRIQGNGSFVLGPGDFLPRGLLEIPYPWNAVIPHSCWDEPGGQQSRVTPVPGWPWPLPREFSPVAEVMRQRRMMRAALPHLLPPRCQEPLLLHRSSHSTPVSKSKCHPFSADEVSQRWEGSIRGASSAWRPQKCRREPWLISRKKKNWHLISMYLNSVQCFSFNRVILGQWEDFDLFGEVYTGLCSLLAINSSLSLWLKDTEEWRPSSFRETCNYEDFFIHPFMDKLRAALPGALSWPSVSDTKNPWNWNITKLWERSQHALKGVWGLVGSCRNGFALWTSHAIKKQLTAHSLN